MTTVARVASLPEIHSIRIALGAAGIEVFVPDETGVFILPSLFFADRNAIRIQVRDEDAERAREILESGPLHPGPSDAGPEPAED